jgi:hypothetical protein
LRVTMLQPTSANSGALLLPLACGQKLRHFLARRCLPFGLVVSHSLISQLQALRDSSVWLRSHLMEPLSLQAVISPTYRLSMAPCCHLIRLRRAVPVVARIHRALNRTQVGLPPALFLPHLTSLLASVSKTISAANSRLRPVTTQQSSERC